MRTSLGALVGLSTAIATVIGGSAIAQTFTLQDGAEVSRHRETGLVNWMSGDAGQPVARAGDSLRSASYAQAAIAFLGSQGAAFGIRNAAAELSAVRVAGDDLGRTFVRLQQSYRGVPIIAAELSVQFNSARDVLSVNGESVGDLSLSVTPEVTAENAAKTAVETTARRYNLEAAQLTGSAAELSILDRRILGGPLAAPSLVWRTEVTSASRSDIREFVLVDAKTGRVSLMFSQIGHAAPNNATQRICDSSNTSANASCTEANAIANPAASPIQDVKDARQFSENTFDFFARRFNRDSLDNQGLTLITTTRYCSPSSSCPYMNAFWNGSQMTYGQDFTDADDVVGHELSHGFTDFSSGLFYFYQSGAINESLSDIFGEFTDQTNPTNGVGGNAKWLMGEDLPIGEIRNMQDPNEFGDPAKMTDPLYWTSSADGGGVHHNSGIGNKTAFLMTDAGTQSFNGQQVTGIGIDKSAAIWYRVNNLLLNSGSDYADLGNALKQACEDLIGTRPKNGAGNPSPDGNITQANCNEVDDAIAATELFEAPPGNAILAEAPVCTGNKVPANKLFERFEGPLKFPPPDFNWGLIGVYAQSNQNSMYSFGAAFSSIDTNLSQTAAVKIPASGFLHFSYYINGGWYNSDSDYTAGMVVEYRIGNGQWKRVTPAMFTHNPYTGKIADGTGNALDSARAFGGFSGGWTSSRVNLSSLANKNVRFRFRFAFDGDASFGQELALDDIRIYSCRNNPNIALR